MCKRHGNVNKINREMKHRNFKEIVVRYTYTSFCLQCSSLMNRFVTSYKYAIVS